MAVTARTLAAKYRGVSESAMADPDRVSVRALKVRILQRLQYAKNASTRPDWILVLLPTALVLKNLFADAGLLATAGVALVIGLLAAAAILRDTGSAFRVQFGPLLLLLAASAIVLSRSSGLYIIFAFFAVATIGLCCAKTLDARTIVSSLLDGIGLYALVNVLCYAIGLRSPTEAEGLRLSLNSDGVNRIIYPLEYSLNLPPVVAAAYLAAICFVIREPGWRRRIFRLASAAAAIAILFGSGTRVPAAAALVLPVLAIVLPRTARWIAPTAAALAPISAFVLPSIIASAQSVLTPLVSLVSERREADTALAALNGRDYVWENALIYWREEISDLGNILLGYGLQGHYTSGASLTYYDLLSHVFTRDAEKIVSTHNSFLQELFDGGLLGWALLSAALLWASVRLSQNLDAWGGYSVAATMVISVVLLCSMTEVLLHPSVTTFWMTIILVAAACQREKLESPERHIVTA